MFVGMRRAVIEMKQLLAQESLPAKTRDRVRESRV